MPVSPSTMAFSSDPPSARPFWRIISTSLRNVNVRAGATSSTNDSSVIRTMLDGFHRHFIARQPGRELDAAQMIDGRRNLVSAQIGTAEANAEVRRRGFEREIDLVAGMKSDSDAGNLTTKRTLCVH